MAEDGELTLHQAADVLGVHYMTVYRYVRLGHLPARKRGTRWWVSRADLDARGRRASPPATGAPWSDRLEHRLVAGDGPGAWSVMEAALAAGHDLDELYLSVLAPAMVSIGERWASGEVDVAVEHRASAIAMRMTGRLGPRFARRGPPRGAVVLATAAGERHGLALALLADLARARGFEVCDLGVDLPPASVAAVAGTLSGLVAVGVSATVSGNDGNVTATVRAVKAAAPQVPVVLGGRDVGDRDRARALGADTWAGDGREFVALLGSLALTRSR